MKKKMDAVRSVLGGAFLAAGLLLLVWLAVTQLRPAERTRYETERKTAVDAAPIALQSGEVNVNRADEAALMELPGIGPVLAEAIVKEREAHGTFFYPEDLMAVKGIGQSRLDAIRELLDLEEEAP